MEFEKDEQGQFSRRGLLGAGVVAASALAMTALASTGEVARADEPPLSTARETITLAAAQALIAAGMAKAQEINVPMSIVIVDESGVMKAFARMDGNSLASVELVQEKAFTAAAFRTPTHILADRNKDDPTRIASFTAAPRVTLLGGGYPIAKGNVVVGGIGAGGGTPEQDRMVAEAALASLA
jgi:uncharacterized protein GlcG (DUF336 family)